jgi:hypothetical protein
MFMPDKHIKLSESLLGLGSYLLNMLSRPQTIDELWGHFTKDCLAGTYPVRHSFENLVLAVDALYAMGAVEECEQSGVLQRCV